MKNRKPFNIPSITKSLRISYETGDMTIEEIAKELYKAGLTFYISIEQAKKLCGIVETARS